MNEVKTSEVYEAQRFCFECPKCEHYNDHLQVEPRDGDTTVCRGCNEEITFITIDLNDPLFNKPWEI